MVGSVMDVSEKLKSLSIDRNAAAKPTGGWKLAAIAGAGIALASVAWAVLGRGPAEPPIQAASVSAPTTGGAAAEAAANRPRGGLVAFTRPPQSPPLAFPGLPEASRAPGSKTNRKQTTKKP